MRVLGWPAFYGEQVLDETAKKNLVDNIADHMKDAQEFIRKRAIKNFASADPEYGRRIEQAIENMKNGK